MGCRYDGTDWPDAIPCTFKNDVQCNTLDYDKCNTWCVCHPEYKRETLASFQGCTVDENGRIIKADDVNHPSHYTDGNIETIDYIEDKKLNYHLGNAVKYISRAGKKDPDKYVEDLKKAIWYLEREIGRINNAESIKNRN